MLILKDMYSIFDKYFQFCNKKKLENCSEAPASPLYDFSIES